MATYYNRHKTATITDRDQVAAIERLIEVCEAAGVEIVDDPSPDQVGGVFFEDVFGLSSDGLNYPGFEEVRRRHTGSELVTVNGWAYESTGDAAWTPVFDPCDIERAWNCSGWDYVVTELGSGGRRPIYEITIMSEDGMVSVSTGVFTEDYDASTIWVDNPEEDEE